MADVVNVPVQLTVEDLSIGSVDMSSIRTELNKKIGTIATSIQNTLGNVDVSKFDKTLSTSFERVQRDANKMIAAQNKFNNIIETSGSSTQAYANAMSEYDHTIARMQVQIDQVSSLYDSQKTKLTSLKAEYSELKSVIAEGSWSMSEPETIQYLQELENAISQTEQQINTYQSQLTDLKTIQYEYAQSAKPDPADYVAAASDENILKISDAYNNLQASVTKAEDSQRNFNNSMQNSYSDQYAELNTQLENYSKKVQSLEAKSEKMSAVGATTNSWNKLASEANYYKSKIDEITTKMMSLVDEGKSFRFGTGDSESELVKLQTNLHNTSESLTDISTKAASMAKPVESSGNRSASVFSKMQNIVRKTTQTISKIGSTGGKALRGISKAVSGVISKFTRLGKHSSKTSNSMSKGFNKLAKNLLQFGLGFRSVYFLIKRLRKVAIEALNTMATQISEVNANITKLNTAFRQLKASLGTLIQPLVSAFGPAIAHLINVLNGAINKLAEFFAALTGQGYIYKATAATEDYAKSLKDAKKAQQNLSGLDQINTFKEADSAGDSGSNTMSGITYEKIDVESSILNFVKKLKDAWKNADFSEIGKVISDKIVTWVSNLPTTITTKVAPFINKILKSAISLLAQIDWKSIGIALAEAVNKLVTSIDWNSLAEAAASLASGMVILIGNAISSIDWDKLIDTLLKALQNMFISAGNALSESDIPLLQSLGKLLQSVGQALEYLGPLLNTIFSELNNVLTPILDSVSELLPPIVELLTSVANLILPVISSAVQQLTPVLTQIIQLILPVLQDLLISLQPLLDTIVNTVLPFLVNLLTALMPLISGILSFITNVSEPLGQIMSSLIELIFSILNPILELLSPIFELLGDLFNQLGELLGPILEIIAPLIEIVQTILEPLVKVLLKPLLVILKVLCAFIKAVLTPVIGVLRAAFEAVSQAVSSAKEVIRGFFEKISEWGSSMWEKFKGIINNVIGGLESFANGAIKAINKVISAMNNLSFDVPDWVPGLGGKTFGFNIKEISEISIPRLAKGAVIPPNKEFMAVLGDQARGNNIETPENLLRQIVREESGNVSSNNVYEFVAQIDRKTLFDKVVEEAKIRKRSTGKNPLLV